MPAAERLDRRLQGARTSRTGRHFGNERQPLGPETTRGEGNRGKVSGRCPSALQQSSSAGLDKDGCRLQKGPPVNSQLMYVFRAVHHSVSKVMP
jgi:hypothetical protein